MPTYDYNCEKCGHLFEVFHAMSANPVKSCPKCKSRKVGRLLGTGAGLLFKGSGFYTTDYRSPGYSAAAKKESSGGKTETKSEAGSAKKAGGSAATA